MEHSGNHQSSVWILVEVKYKGVDNLRTKVMEHIYVYGYVSFALRVLFLIGLVLFSWFALRKIRQRLFWEAL
jgi:hypothetical protein